jgi:mono/diheme cytochrome c family protein
MAIFGTAALALALCGSGQAQQEGKTTPAANRAPAPAAQASQAALIAEGEKRFHANCGRCHQSPHKFPPRMVMTIERHMRVRATLTQEDMQAIVAFLTQ